VGAAISFYGDFDNNMTGSTGFTTNSTSVMMDYAWGWWKMTPELTLAGGYNGSLATIGYGIRKINDAYISRGTVGVDGGDFTQLRVSYNSGPVGVALALEHTDEGDNLASYAGGPFGVAAEVTYSGDVFNAEIAGFLRDADSNYAAAGGKVTQSQIGLGIGAKLSDMFDISAAGSFGNNVWYTDGNGEQWIGDGWEVSAAIVATLSDSVSAEIGAGWSSYDFDFGPGDTTDRLAVAGGVYWSPVSQLKMGAQASWVSVDETLATEQESDTLKAAFVTWWNF